MQGGDATITARRLWRHKHEDFGHARFDWRTRMIRYLVIPYKHVEGAAMPGNPQRSSKLEVARKAMTSLAERFPAVALYSVTVDEATGALSDPTLLDSVGDVPDATLHSIFSSP